MISEINTNLQISEEIIKEYPPSEKWANNTVDLTGMLFGRLTPLYITKVNGKQKWVCQCECGGIRVTTAESLKKGRCRSCGCLATELFVENSKLSPNRKVQEERKNLFKQELKNLVGEEYSALEDYQDQNTPILLRHNLCGHEWKVYYQNFFQKGSRCPNCSPNKKKTSEEIFSIAKSFLGEDYEIIKEESDAFEGTNKAKISIFHKKCEKTYKTSLSIIRQGCGCPYCRQSKGEKWLEEFLEEKNIPFIYQYSFPNSRFRYDFAILDSKNMPILLIEYDGEGHFKQIGNWDFERQKENDEAKDILAEKNGIPLVRIPYTDFKEELNKALTEDALVFLYDNVNHPKHYNQGSIQPIDYIEGNNISFNLGQVVKYITRTGKKDPTKEIEDLKKALWYLNREIELKRRQNEEEVDQ